MFLLPLMFCACFLCGAGLAFCRIRLFGGGHILCSYHQSPMSEHVMINGNAWLLSPRGNHHWGLSSYGTNPSGGFDVTVASDVSSRIYFLSRQKVALFCLRPSLAVSWKNRLALLKLWRSLLAQRCPNPRGRRCSSRRTAHPAHQVTRSLHGFPRRP